MLPAGTSPFPPRYGAMGEYSLSALGRELLPILNAMTRVGEKLSKKYKVA